MREDDSWQLASYGFLMAEGQAHIIVTIDTENPIEIGDFVSAFTSVANQFDKFIATNHPEISGDAHIFVKEVTSGSIIADLIPLAPVFGIPAGAIVYLQHADVVADFVSK
jgi:hypothetical protein